MFLTVTFVLCALFAFSLGKTSNGMTSPRQAFNIFTGPFSAVLGAVIGLLTGLFVGEIGAHLLGGLLAGFVAGLLGLGAARLLRNR